MPSRTNLTITIVTDIHAQERNADARAGTAARPRRGSEAAPVSAVPQVVQLEPPARAAHTSAYGREAVQVLILRPTVQAAQPCAATYEATYRSVRTEAVVTDPGCLS